MKSRVKKMLNIPLEVDLEDLQDKKNSRLFNEEAASDLEKVLSTLPAGRYSKETIREEIKKSGLDWPKEWPVYTMIKEQNGDLYAVYKGVKYGKHLGQGSYGKVKLVQNIKTGSWEVVKVSNLKRYKKEDESYIRVENPNIRAELELLLRAEHRLLKDIKVSHGNFIEAESKTYFIMDYANGENLDSYLLNHQTLSPMSQLNIALQALERVQEVHEKGYIHCDIKPENMRYDALNNKLTTLDYGLSLVMDEDNAAVSMHPRGTKPYRAPETDKNNEKILFSPAVDVYALGILLAELFGFVPFRQVENKKLYLNKHSPFKDNVILTSLIKKMIDKNPEKRPSLDEVIIYFQELREEEASLSAKTTGILNIADFTKEKALCAALKTVDEVILVGELADGKEDDDFMQTCVEARNYLKNMGVNVRSEVLISNNLDTLASDIQKLIEGDKTFENGEISMKEELEDKDEDEDDELEDKEEKDEELEDNEEEDEWLEENEEESLEVVPSQLFYFHSKTNEARPKEITCVEVITDGSKNYQKEIEDKTLITDLRFKKVCNELIHTMDEKKEEVNGDHDHDENLLNQVDHLAKTLKHFRMMHENKESTITTANEVEKQMNWDPKLFKRPPVEQTTAGMGTVASKEEPLQKKSKL